MMDRTSRLVHAMEMWGDRTTSFPNGQFNHNAVIQVPTVVLYSDDIDFEFEVNFDDDLSANEAEITIYNLSDSTVNKFKVNTSITITAGYKDDTGVIFTGNISKVRTKFDGVDRITTISAFDNVSPKDMKIDSLSYSKGTKASKILKDLLKKVPLPLVSFKIERDWTYKEETTVDGEVFENIKKYAEVCGISVYINKGKIYARSLKTGDNINFNVSADTGLIGSPEEYEEETTAEDYKDTIHGYTFKMLLQHRMTTAAIINLKSRNVSGRYRVKSGKHIFNESEFLTELKVIDV